MPAIFLSHSNLDRKISDDIKSSLDRLGFERVFLDFDKGTGIGAGENWEKKLYEELARCHAIILVLTPNWFASKWCFVELCQARALGKIVLPINFEKVGEHFVLPEVQAVDLIDWSVDGLAKLEARLHDISNELARGFRLDRHRPPYPGIHAFEAEDAAIYFGRDDETRAVIERLEARRSQGGARFVILIGASGSGKSSLLKAGVLPQLARRRAHWVLLPHIRPEKTPLASLAKAIAQHVGDPKAWRSWHEKLGCENVKGEVEALLDDLRLGEARAATVLLPIDQFEELFTIATPEERAAFLRLLLTIFDPANDLSVMGIATGRSDVLQGLIEAGDLARVYETMPLAAMPLDRVSRIVEGPAAVAGLNIDHGLSEIIRHDVESSEALPLLAHALYLLHQRGVARHALTIAEYRTLGDADRRLNPIQNSIRLVADQAIGGLRPTDAELAALRDSFVPHLVRVRLYDGKRVRQPATRSKLPKESARLIQALVDARLLSTRVEESSDPNSTERESVVEVSHEALFKAWPILDEWLTGEHEFLSDLERIRNAHEIWDKAPAEQKSHALLHGLLLTRAREWVRRHAQRFVGRDMEDLATFIADSAEAQDAEHKRAEEQRKRAEEQEARARRMERRQARGAAVAAFVFAGIALFALWLYRESVTLRQTAETERQTAETQRQRAETERNQALITQSRFLVDLARQQYELKDYGTAIALSLEALSDARLPNSRPYVPEAESMLYQSVISLRERQNLIGHGESIRAASFSPEGDRAVTASFDNTARIWSVATGKTIATLQHGDHVEVASFSSDGKRVVTGSWDKTARIWDGITGERLKVLENHTEQINAASFSPDGRLVVTASNDYTARIWDAASGKELFTLKHDGWVNSAAFSADSKKVVTASHDKTARVWDASNGKELVRKDLEATVFSAAFSPDGNLFVTASWDKTARIWQTSDGTQLQILRHPDDSVLVAAFSPNGTQVVTAAGNKAYVWDAGTGTEIAKLLGHAEDKNIAAASFSHDGKSIVTAAGDMTARVWDAANGTEIAVLRGHEALVSAAAFSPNGRLVLTASDDHTARIWDGTTDGYISVLRGHTELLESAAFSPDGLFVVTASDDKTARIWNAGNGTLITSLEKHEGAVLAASFSPDGRRVVTASSDNKARIWDAAEPAVNPIELPHGDHVVAASFSRGGSRIVTGSLDKTARIWNAASGAEIKVLQEHTEPLMSANFSADGKLVVTASQDTTARIWDAESGKERVPLLGHENWVRTAVFSEDGKHVVTASQDNTARIWDATTGKTIAKLEHKDQDQVYSAAFSLDGQRVVTASWDSKARVWDLKGNILAELLGHTDRLQSAVFSPDGRRVLTASWDKTARLWDSVTGVEVGVLRGHDEKIRGATFSMNGRSVVTASDDRTARVWPIFATTQDLIDHARSIMPRGLSPEQRARFFLAAPKTQ